MKTKNRLLSIVVLAVTCFVMAIAFMAINLSGLSAKADSTEPLFYIDGISLRKNAGSEGFRVETHVNDEAKKAHGQNAEYGTLFLPKSYIDEGTKLEFNGDGTLDPAIVDVPTKVWGDVDKTFYKSAIVGREDQGGTFPDSYLNMPITAVSYVKTESGAVDYTAPVTRTIAYIAECAVTDGEELVDGSLVKRLIDFNKEREGYKPQLKVGGETTTAITLDKGKTASVQLFLAGMAASTSSKVVVEFGSDNPDVASVASVSDDGATITANAKGRTTITATYKAGEGSSPKTVSVEVNVIDVFSVNAGPYGFKQGDLIIEDAKISGSNVVATYKDTELSDVTISGDTVTIPASNFTAFDEKATIIVETNEVKATVSARIVNAIINDVEDFNKMATDYAYKQGSSNNIGAFILNADLDFKGQSHTTYATETKWSNIVFDGQRHVISNVVISSTSKPLFGEVLYDCHIYDVAVVNVALSERYSYGVAGLIQDGKVENIYVYGKHNTDYRASLFAEQINNTQVEVNNVLVQLDPASTNVSSATSSLVARIGGFTGTKGNPAVPVDTELTSFSNVYSIGKAKWHLCVHTKADDTGWDTYLTMTDETAKGGYDTVDQFLADYNNFEQSFKSVFKYETSEEGSILKFYDYDISYCVEKEYYVGVKNGDMTFDVATFGDSTDLTVTRLDNGATINVVDGKLDKTGLTSGTSFDIKVADKSNNVWLRTVKVVDAVLYNAADLDKIYTDYYATFDGTKTFSGTFVLGGDIDYEGKTFTAVAENIWSSLNFDGQGYKIENIVFSGKGLFYTINGGAVKNLWLSANSVTGNWTRAVANTVKNTSIDNIYVVGAITQYCNFGGLVVGDLYNTSTMTNIVAENTHTTPCTNWQSLIAKLPDETASTASVAYLSNVYSYGKTIDRSDYHVIHSDNIKLACVNGGYALASDFYADKANVKFDANTMRFNGANLEMYNSDLGQWRVVRTYA